MRAEGCSCSTVKGYIYIYISPNIPLGIRVTTIESGSNIGQNSSGRSAFTCGSGKCPGPPATVREGLRSPATVRDCIFLIAGVAFRALDVSFAISQGKYQYLHALEVSLLTRQRKYSYFHALSAPPEEFCRQDWADSQTASQPSCARTPPRKFDVRAAPDPRGILTSGMRPPPRGILSSGVGRQPDSHMGIGGVAKIQISDDKTNT